MRALDPRPAQVYAKVLHSDPALLVLVEPPTAALSPRCSRHVAKQPARNLHLAARHSEDVAAVSRDIAEMLLCARTERKAARQETDDGREQAALIGALLQKLPEKRLVGREAVGAAPIFDGFDWEAAP